MQAEMGQPAMAAAPVLKVLIEFVPGQGLRVGWPNIDAVSKLGILEAAKATVMMEMIKGQQAGLVVPATGLP